MAKSKWIKGAIKHPGAFTKYCRGQGYNGVTAGCIAKGRASSNHHVMRMANFANTLRRLPRHHGPRK